LLPQLSYLDDWRLAWKFGKISRPQGTNAGEVAVKFILRDSMRSCRHVSGACADIEVNIA
jgi:hypothetical protein